VKAKNNPRSELVFSLAELITFIIQMMMLSKPRKRKCGSMKIVCVCVCEQLPLLPRETAAPPLCCRPLDR
jgi:hypothetical protein